MSDVIRRITRQFERRHVITDKPLDDLPGIGEMHYGGHGDDPES